MSNPRCLEFLAEYALPNHLEVDDSLSQPWICLDLWVENHLNSVDLLRAGKCDELNCLF